MIPSALALLAFTAFALAQDFRATISGLVTDQNGQVVANATVKAIRGDTNETKEVRTTSEGRYTIPYLNPGIYNIEVTADGFQTLKRNAITLRVADKLDLPLQLNVGAVSDVVTVTGQQEVIETGSADRGSVFDPIKTQELPLNGRQTYMLMSLTPGVIFTQEQFGSSGFSGTRGWDVNNSYRINGARPGENLFLLNGAPISDNGGTWQLAPNVEAVQEFKVQTNTYDAAYGRFGGGVVNTTLKSGSNNWHGNVFEYWRNRILDANSFQSNFAHRPKDYHNQHQFGGVLGGPIRKDKDFIFASFEGWQEVIPFPALSSTVPTLLRDGQHFSDFGITVYDPLTTHRCGTEPGETAAFCGKQTFVRDPFPGNVIPKDRISPIGQKILSYYPAPNAGSPTALNNNFVGNTAGRYYYEQPMVRWDHVFSENDKFNVVWTYQRGYEYRDSTGFGKPDANGNTNNERRDINAILSWTHVISPTAVLDVRGSFGRFTQITPGYSDLNLTATSLGMTDLVQSPSAPYDIAPQINGSYTRIFSSGSVLSRTPFSQWNFTPSLSLTRGRHTLHTGFEFNYQVRGNYDTGVTSFTFNQNWTQQFPQLRNGALDGNGVASLLLGTPTSGSISDNDSTYRTRPYYAFYLQDDWKVNSRLSLNLGLRYEIQVPWKERFNRTNRGFDPTVISPLSDQILANWATLKAQYDATHPNDIYGYPAPPAAIYGSFLFPGQNGAPERLYDTDWTNVAPRIGVAWRVRENTVIRAGAGVYYQSTTQLGTTTGFSVTTPYTTSLDGGITPSAGLTGPFSLVNPFPNGIFLPQGASGGALTGIGGGISFDPAGYRVPRSYQYSLGIQQQLWRKFSAEVSYAGNYQNHIEIGYDINEPGLANQNIAIADPNYYNRTLANPFFGVLPTTTGLGSSNTTNAGNLLRPFPIFSGGITNNLIQQGKYRSDALQVKIEQRDFGNAHGAAGVLTWTIAYTFSKAYEMNHRLNSWDTAEPLIRELDNNDKPHTLSIYGVWDLPFGKNRRFLNSSRVVDAFLGNWRFTPIFTYVSGYPVGWPNWINNCGTWQATNQNEDHWINNDKSCLQQFPTNSLRTIPDRFPNIRQPQAPQVNAALEKMFSINERYRFSFRVEAFNATNTPIRGGVDTDPNSQTFGQLPKSQNNFPRFFQLSGKFYF
ncbi:MAG: TonB-dependent receptor [Chloracidobacterium sp.]|nr:TonB-dependent receptor [Chloracidobacterium sp.]